MPFGSLTGAQQLLIKLYLRGGPQFRAEMAKSGFAVDKFAVSESELAKAMSVTNKRTFLHNQLMFMARRGLFYATLGVVGLGVALTKLGFQYNSTLQTATVAFKGFIGGEAAAKKELQELYVIAAESPFEFPDIVMATRRLLPFVSGVEEANTVVRALIDGLSGMGVITGAALNRAALAMSHMYNMGVLTGQVMTQLNRDNVPMLKALMYYFHKTGEEIHEAVGDRLISATVAAKALSAYMQTPGFKGAAFEQATKTLAGGYATFIDILRIAMGRSQGGLFQGLTDTIQKIDEALLPLIRGSKPITLENVAKVIDQQISPSTHALLNTFVFFKAFLTSLIGTLYIFLKVLSFILWPINQIGNLFGAAGLGAKILGTALGILTGLFLINRTATMLNGIATEAYALKQIFLRDAIMKTVAAQKLQNLWATKGTETKLAKLLFGSPGVAQPAKYKATQWTGRAMPDVMVGGTQGLIAKMFDTEKSGGMRNRIKSIFKAFRDEGKTAGFSQLRLGFKMTGEDMTAFGKKMKGFMSKAGMKQALAATRSGVLKLIAPITSLTIVSTALEAANMWWLWIPLIIAAVVIGLVILYKKWDWFHYLVQDTFSWIKKHWKQLLLFIPFIGPIIYIMIEIVKHTKDWFGWILKLIDKVKILVDWLEKAKKFMERPFGLPKGPSGKDLLGYGVRGFKWAFKEDVKERAGGGGIFSTSPVLVGEHGPELIVLPGGANVIPSHALNANGDRRVDPIGRRDRGDNNDRPIVVQVMLDRKVLAEGVARANQDYAARR